VQGNAVELGDGIPQCFGAIGLCAASGRFRFHFSFDFVNYWLLFTIPAAIHGEIQSAV
jgi:hypothetical protein